jgi:SAM-dependent methyltransferase
MTIRRHQDALCTNHISWQNKAILRIIYRRFYTQIASILTDASGFPIVEIGSGIGQIAAVIPSCIKTDLFPNPWIDQVENAYQLSFKNESISNLILMDVFHHLEFPGSALAEFHRVLIPGGRIILVEPCLSLLGLLVYGCLHKEPLGLIKRIKWQAPQPNGTIQQGYYAAQGNAFRVFCRQAFQGKLNGWNMVYRERIPALSYIASGGYSKPAFIKPAWLRQIDAIDRLLLPFPFFFATRLLVGLEKIPEGVQDSNP